MYMKKVMMIMVLGALVACLIPAQAQKFTSANIENQAIQSQQIMQSGAAYEGTVYEPFSNSTPSEQSEVGGDYSTAQPNVVSRRSLIGGPEDPSGPSPIGDGVWLLMLMALVYGIWSIKMVQKHR